MIHVTPVILCGGFGTRLRLPSALIEQFKLKDRYGAKTLTDARKELAEKVRIASGKDGLMSVEVDDKDPQLPPPWPTPTPTCKSCASSWASSP